MYCTNDYFVTDYIGLNYISVVVMKKCMCEHTGLRPPRDLLVKDCIPLLSPKVVPGKELFNGLSPPTVAGSEFPNPGCPRNGARESVFSGPREDPRLFLFVCKISYLLFF
jgi:hypothetical protein